MAPSFATESKGMSTAWEPAPSGVCKKSEGFQQKGPWGACGRGVTEPEKVISLSLVSKGSLVLSRANQNTLVAITQPLSALMRAGPCGQCCTGLSSLNAHHLPKQQGQEQKKKVAPPSRSLCLKKTLTWSPQTPSRATLCFWEPRANASS